MAILGLEINIPTHCGRKPEKFQFSPKLTHGGGGVFTILLCHFTKGLWPGPVSKFNSKISFWQVMGIPIAPTGQITLFTFHFEKKIDESGGKFQFYFKRVSN